MNDGKVIENWTIGVVVKDKGRFTRMVKVYPFSALPYFEGDLDDSVIGMIKKGVDANGREYSVNLKAGAHITAEWIGSGNRWTSPSVVKGEQVKLWRVGDSDIWYWDQLGRDDRLRRTETIVFGMPSISGENSQSHNMDNCWTLTVSSDDKHITLKTTTANNEFCKYTAQFDLKEGFATILDDLGNVFRFDSKNTVLTMINADGTIMELNKKDARLHADNNIDIDAGNDVTMTAGNNVSIKAGTDCSVDAGANVSTNSGASTSITSGADVAMEAATTVDVTAPDGMNVTTPMLKTSANMSVGGVLEALSAEISVDAVIGGISFIGHTHPVITEGSPSGSPM